MNEHQALPDQAPDSRQQMLNAFLADADVPCPGCKYNLRGLHGDRCPECREELGLRVSLKEPNVGAWLITMIGLCCGAGAAGIGLVMMAALSIIFGNWPPGAFFLIMGVALVTEGGLATVLARPTSRRWFRARTGTARARVALGAWLLTCFFVITMIIYIAWLS